MMASPVVANGPNSPLATQASSQLHKKRIPSQSSFTPSLPSDDRTDNRDAFLFDPDILRIEEERLKTFENWPVPFLAPVELARNGFYYLGRRDEVRCAFCKVEIMRWVEGDDPAADHKRWAPQCPFLKKQSTSGNVPGVSSTNSRDECGIRAPRPPSTALCMQGPVHAQYASQDARIRSFKDWPLSMPQKPEDLAEAGFFYTGHGDKTKCFYCDGGLKDWEVDDIPWEQHARWFDRCAYVKLVKGRDYVQKVKTEACMISSTKEDMETKTKSTPEPTKPVTNNEEETNIDDSKLCKICYSEERNVVFIPCGHVVACAKCALSNDKCPMCRSPFQNAVKLFYS